MTLNQLDLFNPTDTGALFSECGRYRYTLWRRWSEGPSFLAIMLNPSTADEVVNDPTVQRVQIRAKSLGFGRLVVTNIFAYRATDPVVMRAQSDPVGPENDRYITEQAQQAEMIMLGWGNHGAFRNRGQEVLRLLEGLGVVPFCLGLTGSGQPRHPLYVSYQMPLQRCSRQ